MEIHISDLKDIYYTILNCYSHRELFNYMHDIADCIISSKSEISHTTIYQCMNILFHAMKIQPHSEKRANIMSLYYILNSIKIVY